MKIIIGLHQVLGNPLFDTAVQFAVDFLYPLLPCNNITSNNEFNQQELNIYPNPASDQINVTSNFKITEIKIYNTIGKLIMDNSIQKRDFTINVNDLIPGVYFLELANENGITETKKIMIR